MQTPRYALPAALVLVVLAAAAPVSAGVDVDFGAAVRVDDDTDLFFRISSRYFDCDRATVSRWSPRYRDPDDLTVALFIHRHSGRSLDEVYALRHQRGLTWWEISVRYGIPVDVWFVAVERDPGPPYGKAYGHWKKHKHGRRVALALTDREARDLVAMRMAHEYYGVSVDVAMSWRSDGRSVRDVMAGEYKRRHGKSKSESTFASGGQPGKGAGNGRDGKQRKKHK